MNKVEQKLINLWRSEGKYYNFFNTSGSNSLQYYLDDGWVVKQMSINEEDQNGWVLLERIL